MTSVLGSLRRAREWAYLQLTSSAFLEKGVLTPEEFVTAGDELVFLWPTWEWQSSSSQQKKKGVSATRQAILDHGQRPVSESRVVAGNEFANGSGRKR